MKCTLLTLIVSLLFAARLFGQQPDTLRWDELISIVKSYHPVAAQAKLLNSAARAQRLKAWGGFDPQLSASYDRKLYDGTEYYRFLTPQATIPLWYGLRLKGSYSSAEGAYLNPENKLPEDGLAYAGVGATLGKGLLIDERRAALKQARIFAEASVVEQNRMLNDLMLDAGKAYVNWQNRHRLNTIYHEALQLAEVRLAAVKTSFKQGDSPAIDTTEALTQYLQRQEQALQAGMALKNALYGLSMFMWMDDNIPADADKLSIAPQSEGPLHADATQSIANNPKLLAYRYKLQELTIERRLKAEALKPEINVQIGLLNEGKNPLRSINYPYWQNNNKLDIQLSFPLTLSKARGDLAETKIKIENTRLDQVTLQNQLSIKLKQNQTEYDTLVKQQELLQNAVEANTKLAEGEQTRFRMGESSLFLVNSRESKLLETLEKLADIQAKLYQNRLEAKWIEGNGW